MSNKKTAISASLVLVTLIAFYFISKPDMMIQAREDLSTMDIRDYSQARPVFWNELYPAGGETLYCGQTFSGTYNKAINIEHVFPMSWVAHKLKCGKRRDCRNNSSEFNLIEADMHNLYPARADINETRRSHTFAIIKGEKREFGSCDFEIDINRRVVEPRKEVRGEIARAMLYMADRYDLYLKKNLRTLLLKWHREEPATNEEIQRNFKIEKIQGNTNHWISNPN